MLVASCVLAAAHPMAAETVTIPIDGAAQVHALAEAYPGIIDAVEYRDGDWAVRIDATWFYWSNGRMLPDKARERWEHYAPLRFASYRRGPLRLPQVDSREAMLLSDWIDRMEDSMPGRHNGFLGALYGVMRASQAAETMVVTRLFGIPVRVHPLVVGPLHRVERDIAHARHTDPEIARFVDSITDIGGFHWRHVAGSYSLSFHAYGVAIDLIPSDHGRRFVYWRWAAVAGVHEWWAIPLEDRLRVPQGVIELFERHGFIWGGRWVFFDQIHFEYRPEVLLLADGAG